MLMQIKPNECKEIQIKRLGFPWIPLVELGLFRGYSESKEKITVARWPRLEMHQTHGLRALTAAV
jgi:hypothetical protein